MSCGASSNATKKNNLGSVETSFTSSIWFKLISTRDFGSFAELRSVFGSVDKVGKFTVFDVGGNKYRLIAAIHHNSKKVYIRHVLTHAEYDREKWKD